MKKRTDILTKITRVVDKTAPGAEVYLYGSHARGDAKPLSDWDILILLNSKTISFNLETKFMDEFYELELETGAIICPIVYTKKDWDETRLNTPLYENIKREGVRLK